MSMLTFERIVSVLGLAISIAAFAVSVESSIATSNSATKTASIAVQGQHIALAGQKLGEEEFSLRLFADIRPWISIKPIVKSVTVESNTMEYVEIEFELENHGRSAGLDLDIDVEASVSDTDDVKNKCKSSDKKTDTLMPLGTQTLLPSEKIIDPKSVRIDGYAPFGAFEMTGCVTYHTTIDRSSHQTRFSYRVRPQKDPMDKSSYQTITNVKVEPEVFTSFIVAD